MRLGIRACTRSTQLIFRRRSAMYGCAFEVFGICFCGNLVYLGEGAPPPESFRADLVARVVCYCIAVHSVNHHELETA